MPLIQYSCECKKTISKFFRQIKEIPNFIICFNCGKEMKKLLSSSSSVSKIIIDNGIQARPTEIIPNIVELNEERSDKTYREE